MDFKPRRRPSLARRISDRALRFPGLRIFWWIFTFGYSFPRVRTGENLGFCISKNVVIFLIRFSCIMGAIWYIGSWLMYVGLGNERPFNMSERQMTRVNGTTVPTVNLFSTGVNQISVDSVQYTDWNSSFPLNFTVSNSVDANLPGQEMFTVFPNIDVLATGSYLASVQVVVKHSLPLTTFGWTIAGLLHPLKLHTEFTAYDMTNQYYFLPGHYVEIHYTPMQFSQDYESDSTTSSFKRFQVFMGYGGQETDYSYQSSALVTPFLPGTYDNATTVIIIRPLSNIEIISSAEEKVTFRDTMSNIGGLIGIIGSIIVFLFGASLSSPWGFVAEIPYFRNRIGRSMAEAYNTKNGLSKGPFTITTAEIGLFDKNIITPDQKIALLKERVDELESALSEYYLDGEVFINYANNREKLKSSKHASGRASLGPSVENLTLGQQQEYLPQQQEQRLSQPLMESQHQYNSPLAAQQSPTYQSRQQSAELQRRDASEPSVTAYHRQLTEEQSRKGRRNSARTPMMPMPENDVFSPTQTWNMSEQDLQMQGLLQRENHAQHQQHFQQQQQQQQQQPTFPPRPKTFMMPLTVNTTAPAGQSAGAEAGRNQIRPGDISWMQTEF